MKTDPNVYVPRQQVIAVMGPLTSENVDEIVEWHNRTVTPTMSRWRRRGGQNGVSIHYDNASIHGEPLARAGQYVVLVYERNHRDELWPNFTVMGSWFTKFFKQVP